MKAKQVTIGLPTTGQHGSPFLMLIEQGVRAELGNVISLEDLEVSFGQGTVIKGKENGEWRMWVLTKAVPVIMEIDVKTVIETVWNDVVSVLHNEEG